MLDADALFALAGRLETLGERAGPTALTPHAGELGRLLGRDSAAIGSARLASVTEAAERSGAAVLLKGPDTLVAAPGEPLRVVETAVPQLATAGAGDVLAGAVGRALRARAPAGRGARARRRRARIGRPPGGLRHPGRSSPRICCCRWGACSRDALDAAGRSRRDARERPAAARGRGRQPAVGRRQGRRLRARSRRVRGRRARRRRRARVLCDARGGARAARRASATASPIVVLSPLEPGEEAAAGGFEIVVSSLEDYARLRAAGVSCGVHVKADTGMGRWGMAPADALATGRELAAGDGPLRLAGLMSHLATADDDPAFAARADGGLRRSRARVPALPATPRQLGRRPGAARDALRRRALRDRALRRLAVRRRSVAARPRSPPCAGRAASPGCATSRRASRRATGGG